MKIFKKIFKGIGSVFKSIGKGIKKAFKGFGKIVNKLGIFGQIGMFVLSMYAGPALWGALSNSLTSGMLAPIGKMASGVGKFIGTAAKGTKAMMAKSKIGKVLLEGAKRISNAAKGVKRLTIDQLGSIAKGTKNMITTTVKAAGEKLGIRATGQAVTATQAATTGTGSVAAQAGSEAALTSISYNPVGVTQAAGGTGYTETLKAIGNNMSDEMATKFWDAGDLSKGFFKGGARIQAEASQAFSADLAERGLEKLDLTKMMPGDKPFGTTGTGLPQPDASIIDPLFGDTAKSIQQKSLLTPIDYTPKQMIPEPSSLAFEQTQLLQDKEKFNIGRWAEQKMFDPQQGIASATIQHGSTPIKPFDKEKFNALMDQSSAQALRTGVQASMPIEDIFPRDTSIGYRAATPELMAAVYQQGGVNQPIADFGGEFQISPNAFLANYSVTNETNEYDRAYNDFISGAAHNQSVNYAQG